MSGQEWDTLARLSVDVEKLQAKLKPKHKAAHDKLSEAEYAYMQLEGKLQAIARLVLRKKLGAPLDGLRP